MNQTRLFDVPEPEVRLAEYDWTVVNSSAGKDSQAMLDYLCERARTEDCLDRVVVVHADLGRVEWQGTKGLASLQAATYGVRFEVVKHRTKTGRERDLLEYIEERGMFPDSQNRYCTSDMKRGPVSTLFTRLAREFHQSSPRRCRILNCMGMRAQESPARAKRAPFVLEDSAASNGVRRVTQWLPIHRWTVEEVWARIRRSGVPWHFAYDLGMPRLSCAFCIFATRPALLLAGKHNPELLEAYVQVEAKIGHTFRQELSLASVQAALQAGEEPGKVVDWAMS